MRFVIRIIGAADGRHTKHDGRYLVGVDLDARGGRGTVTSSPEIRTAHRFEHAAEALEYWRRIAPRHQWRPDGEPNRPLTAYTVEVISEHCACTREARDAARI